MSQRVSLTFLLAILLPLCIVLSACDSGGSNSIDNEFSLTINPVSSSSSAELAQSKSLNGFSFFYDAENPETGEQFFAIYLNDEESFSSQSAQSGLFGFIGRASSRPSTGTYQLTGGGDVAASDFAGALWEDIQGYQQGESLYVLESGTLTLDASDGDRVAGSIDAQATELIFTDSGSEQNAVSIEGNFTAKDADTFVPLSGPGI